MNKTIYIVNNYNTDKFKDFQVPAFNEGESYTMTSSSQNVEALQLNSFPFDKILLCVIVVLIVVVLIHILAKIKENFIYQIQNALYENSKASNNYDDDEEEKSEIAEQQIIPEKPKKARKYKSYATPQNLQQCIYQFLENTKNK